MKTNTSTVDNPHESMELIKEMQRKSLLKAIPSRQFNIMMALTAGLAFMLLGEQSRLALISGPLFAAIIYYEKYKSGMWPYVILASKESQINYWDLFTNNVVSNTLSLLFFLSSFPWIVIYTMELKASGLVWAPFASGTLMALSVYFLGQNISDYCYKKFSRVNHE
jgi:hypothetical protein